MVSVKHIHKYQKVILGRNKDYVLYKCMIPSCTHNLQPELMLGIEAMCYDCGTTFTINSRADLIERLKCLDCRKGPDVDSFDILKILEELNNEDV